MPEDVVGYLQTVAVTQDNRDRVLSLCVQPHHFLFEERPVEKAGQLVVITDVADLVFFTLFLCHIAEDGYFAIKPSSADP